MAVKRALIVDDSKSARLFPRREFSRSTSSTSITRKMRSPRSNISRPTRPDVIFMDHMMPGMDGFQAVQPSRTIPAPATIPIMMYTSQEGEL